MTSPTGYNPAAYPPFAVTADVVVLTDDLRQVLLVERGKEPFKGVWALPGGFVEIDEDLIDAAVRELAEETGLAVRRDLFHQLGAYGEPGRDPRMRVVSIVFWTRVDDNLRLRSGSDAADAFLADVADVLAGNQRLAFDHHRVIRDALLAAEAAPRD